MLEPIKLKLKIDTNIAKFIAKFITFIAVFYFLSIVFESFIPLFSIQSTSTVLYGLLKILGINVTAEANVLTFENFSIQVVRQCTGIFEVIAILSCILAFPSPVKKKILGIYLAVPIIYLFNMSRLIFLSLLGIYYPFVFTAIHDYLLQLTFVFLVIFFWIFWINKVVNSEKG